MRTSAIILATLLGAGCSRFTPIDVANIPSSTSRVQTETPSTWGQAMSDIRLENGPDCERLHSGKNQVMGRIVLENTSASHINLGGMPVQISSMFENMLEGEVVVYISGTRIATSNQFPGLPVSPKEVTRELYLSGAFVLAGNSKATLEIRGDVASKDGAISVQIPRFDANASKTINESQLVGLLNESPRHTRSTKCAGG